MGTKDSSSRETPIQERVRLVEEDRVESAPPQRKPREDER